MNMRVIESGHGKMAAEIDDLSLRALLTSECPEWTRRHDFAISDGDGLDPPRYHGACKLSQRRFCLPPDGTRVDITIDENNVSGGWLLCFCKTCH